MADIPMPAGYSADEAIAIIAPLCGVKPAHLDAYLIVGINTKRACGHIGGTDNLPAFIVPTILRMLADQMEKEDTKDIRIRRN